MRRRGSLPVEDTASQGAGTSRGSTGRREIPTEDVEGMDIGVTSQDKTKWKQIEGRGAKRARAGSSEEEEAPLTLQEVTYKLGSALLQLRQWTGKASVTAIKAHERELSDIYRELQRLSEETPDTTTQGTQTEGQYRNEMSDILDVDLSDEQLIDRLSSRWSSWVMNRLTQVNAPKIGEDSCHFVDLNGLRPSSHYAGATPGAMVLQDSTILEDGKITTCGTKYTVIFDSSNGEKAMAAHVIKALRRVVGKSESAVFVVPNGPSGIIIKKIVIYLMRKGKTLPRMVLPNLSEHGRARSRSASNRRGTPPVTESKTVVVQAPGKTYADLLKTVKDKVKAEEAGDILSIRKGRDQQLEVRISGSQKAGEFSSLLKNRAEELQVDIRTKGDRRTVVHVKDLLYDTTEREIKEAIEKVLGVGEGFQITSIREAYGNTKNATVVTNQRNATKLIASRLRVGWVCCRAYIRTEVEKCYRCWNTGHGRRECRGPDRSELCFNCGRPGHVIKDCKEATRCLDCGSTSHRTANTSCNKNHV